MIALSFAGSATLLFSCRDKGDSVVYDYETLLTESSEHRTITMMENGQRSYIFSAPLIEGYSMATNPYQEFRRGIDMTTFTSDSLSLIDATIRANYAIYYERQKLWEAKGNVVINKFNRSDGDTLITDTTKVYTQQLFWNATTKKIYSNVDTKVLQKDGWHFGVGFDADEDLKNIHFRKYSSEVEFDMSREKHSEPEGSNNISDDDSSTTGSSTEKSKHEATDVSPQRESRPRGAESSTTKAEQRVHTTTSRNTKGAQNGVTLPERGVPTTPSAATRKASLDKSSVSIDMPRGDVELGSDKPSAAIARPRSEAAAKSESPAIAPSSEVKLNAQTAIKRE